MKAARFQVLDAATQMWLRFFPDAENGTGSNTLTTFAYGGTYWIAVTEAVTWTVAKNPLCGDGIADAWDGCQPPSQR